MNANMPALLDPPSSSSVAESKAERAARAVGCPAWKRGIDVTLVLLTLPIWLPIMILLACGIKLVSPGCVFFRQERIGLNGRHFTLLKFRSMKMHVATNVHETHFGSLIQTDRPMTKLDARDPRIIPLGRLLRASGLDELPQIFNVLAGDMSLVGPRPCTPHELSCYEPWQRARFNALPGLTGYWQVHGKNRTTFSEMINMDIHYVRSMSLGMDLSIMLMTFPTIMGQVLEVRQKNRREGQRREPSHEPIPQEV